MSLVSEDAVIVTSTPTKTKKTSSDATAKSLLALALHAWTLCVLAVVLAALLLLAPAALLLAFPVACMAASLYLLCAITARLLVLAQLPLPLPDRARDERRGCARDSRKQDCVEVDRAEVPGGFDDDASSAEEERGERSEHAGGRGDEFSSLNHGEQRRFFFVDTYYKSIFPASFASSSRPRRSLATTGPEAAQRCCLRAGSTRLVRAQLTAHRE
ncbi:hypothetical protein QOZ80_6BG0491820 [Eleusine coracana subsp. coracana]|nr:hypothetical protein QOZ80_6BG0491820 [Eleusine coracana subsp. coracana]